MSLNEQEFIKLKREVEQAKSEADEAKGALSQLMSRLREEFECSSVKNAEALLDRMRKRQAKLEKEFDAALEAYKKQWKPNDDED